MADESRVGADSRAIFDGCKLAAGPSSLVVAVEDGETLVLASGTRVRLIGAMAPRKPLILLSQKNSTRSRSTGFAGRNGNSVAKVSASTPAWPLSETVQDQLSRLVVGQSVTLWSASTKRQLRLSDFPRDRYDRVLAHVSVETFENAADTETAERLPARSVWVQAVLLRSGLARAYSTTDARNCIAQLLKHEAAARSGRHNLWAHRSYRVLDARKSETLLQRMHTYQIVEGRVRKVARYRNTTYVNFGYKWKTDFTLIIEGRANRRLKKGNLDPRDLEGQRIRVRGWIERRDGPMMRLTHPEQIERLEPGLQPSTLFGSGALAAFDQLRAGSERSAGSSGQVKPQDQDRRHTPQRREPGVQKSWNHPPRKRLDPLRERANAVRDEPVAEPEFLSM